MNGNVNSNVNGTTNSSVQLIRVLDILQSIPPDPCMIPNFRQLGLYQLYQTEYETHALDDLKIITHKKPPVRGVTLENGNVFLENLSDKIVDHKRAKHANNIEIELDYDENTTNGDKFEISKLPQTVSELRQVLQKSTFIGNVCKPALAEKTSAKSPLPPAAAHTFVKMMLENKTVKDIALAIPPKVIEDKNSKKRKRGSIGVDIAADIFNEDRSHHIHGWVELQTEEKKSFYVIHYQPLLLDVDSKEGGQYDESTFWIELRPSAKGCISAIHSEKVDWFVVQHAPKGKNLEQQSGPKFFVCDRQKLCDFLYTKLPEKGTTTNNPFDTVYTIYREGRRLQLKTQMPFQDLLSEKLVEFIV